MVQFNFFRREVNCKIVYYGPGLSGKTTNLEVVHKKTPGSNRGELTSIATEQDRTLFFDFMPIDLGTVGGMKTKLRLFTVPGQVYYNSTRKLVLQGADGVIFVADSQKHKIEENLESLENLKQNLAEHGMDIHKLPLVIQWNKRDMPAALPIEELERQVNYLNCPTYPAVAVTGEGVFPTLKKCAALVLEDVNRKAAESTHSVFTPNSTFKQKPAQAQAPSASPQRGPVFRPQQHQTPKPQETPIQRPSMSPTFTQNQNRPGGQGAPSAPGTQKPLFKKFKKFLDKDKDGALRR